ncbi:SRPBCC family protein [Sandaracinobacter sp. RS1-74]|uniref:SRPBCC family protein n=1 Tax=Sandaracinobacteroides sayramensis TaxID=2913411 RepID=UPI001EDA8D15|nr:SRPBCC family protein [Sandaracinobacteroides sayramensis]MCG2841977.1 SRPBCC family protein [Sandaracinobacteroides sayramensis]
MADVVTAQSLRFERLLDAPVEKVWQFLVDPDLRGRWFMGGPTEARPGGRITMTMHHDRLSDETVPTPERYRPYLGQSWEERIIRCEAPHLLTIGWEDGAAGEVTFELHAQEGKTRLILTHSGLRGRADAANFGGGWHSHLAALERRVRGEGVADFWALHAAAEAEMQRLLG